ncbi:MAG: RidA family protein [Opitutales bacterium]
MNPEEIIASFEIELPAAPAAAGLYKPMVMVGDLAYLSGHLPIMKDGSLLTGEVGNGTTIDEGFAAARQAGLNMLATLREGLGSLNRVVRVVKLLGLVNSPAGFSQHPQVINGCSELLKEIWGEDLGVGVRSAYGVSGLPGGAAVEIEGILKIKE